MKILSISEASLFLGISKTTSRLYGKRSHKNKNILLNQNSQQLTSNNNKNSQRN